MKLNFLIRIFSSRDFYTVILIILTGACSGGEKSNMGKVDNVIPDSLMDAADQFVKSRTGDLTFKEYIHPDYTKNLHKKGFYEVHYKYIIPGKSFVNEDILFYIDSTGNVLHKFEIKGIPNCKYKPEECEYNIDSTKAVELAGANGMKKGIRDWNVDFQWSGNYNKYVWHIISTYNEKKSRTFYKANGDEIMLDPNDGKVIMHKSWSIK